MSFAAGAFTSGFRSGPDGGQRRQFTTPGNKGASSAHIHGHGAHGHGHGTPTNHQSSSAGGVDSSSVSGGGGGGGTMAAMTHYVASAGRRLMAQVTPASATPTGASSSPSTAGGGPAVCGLSSTAFVVNMDAGAAATSVDGANAVGLGAKPGDPSASNKREKTPNQG